MVIDQSGVDDPTRMPRLGSRSAALTYAMGMAHGGHRDYYENFGWKRNPSIEDYYAAFLKNPYFNACIEIPAKTAWRDPPEIVDGEDSEADEDTSFESDVEDVVNSTRFNHYAKRAHILARIGEFGLLMIGWADGEDKAFADPVDGAQLSSNDPDEAIDWLRPFSQISVEDIKWAKRGSGRWGKPEYYKIDFSDENNDATADLYAGRQQEQWVHYSRVLHIAPDLLDDEVRGIPPGESIYNTCQDLQKLEGSAAESAYAIARPGISVTIDKDADPGDDGLDHIDQEAADYVDEHQNFMVMQGAEAKRISAETVDPSNIKDSLIEALSAATKIPQKKFKGNESGEVAGAQDLREFYGTVQEEREQVATPQIYREFVDRLIRYTVVSEHGGDEFDIDWPAVAEQDDQQESEIQANRGGTISDVAPYMPSLSSSAIAEFIETGEFPDLEDSPDVEPMDPAEDAGAPPPETPTPPPAVADGGEEDGDTDE